MLRALSTQENKFLKDMISPLFFEVKEQNQKSSSLVIRVASNDRANTKKEIESKLTSSKQPFSAKTSGGSIGTTSVLFAKHNVNITYKPTSGGMSETTLNSTITELAPCIAFMANKKFNTVKSFYKFLSDNIDNDYGVYVNATDKRAGQDFIRSFPSSSKFKEKMENAIGVLNYLYELNKDIKIKQLYWGYRAKPHNIPAAHKGDIFAKFENDTLLGISLKAGGENTHEPQFNTYVNKMYDEFGDEKSKESLKKKIYEDVHSTLGLDDDWDSRTKKSKSVEVIEQYKKKYPSEYEKKYNQMLEIIRSDLIELFNKNVNKSKQYIQTSIIGSKDDVPLVVVKAFGMNYKLLSDEDDLDIFLKKTKKINAVKSKTSKQNWTIKLSYLNNSLNMKMSVRSNKSSPNNKIAQGFNLAIKFNGVSKYGE